MRLVCGRFEILVHALHVTWLTEENKWCGHLARRALSDAVVQLRFKEAIPCDLPTDSHVTTKINSASSLVQ